MGSRFRAVMILIVISLLFFLQPGCATQNKIESPERILGSSLPPDENYSLTVMLNTEPSRQMLANIAELEKNLGIKTVFKYYPTGMEGDNFLKTSLATGDMPDIFKYNSGALLHALKPAENLLDLTEEPFMAKISNRFKEESAVDGRNYAVPESSFSVTGWIYNSRVYENLNLEIPHTWDDLIANCKIIKDAGIIPVIGAYESIHTAQHIFLADEYNVKAAMPDFPQVFTAGKAKYSTTPCALRSFEKLEEASQYLNDNCLETSFSEGLDMLATGAGAHLPTGVLYAARTIEQNHPDRISEIGFFGQPGDDPDNQGAIYGLPQSLYVYKNSPKTELAKKWLESYISQGNNNRFDFFESSYEDESAPKWEKQIRQYFDDGRICLALEFESPLKGPDCAKICLEVLTGMTDARSAAEAYDRDVEKQAIQLKLPGW